MMLIDGGDFKTVKGKTSVLASHHKPPTTYLYSRRFAQSMIALQHEIPASSSSAAAAAASSFAPSLGRVGDNNHATSARG